MRHLVDQAQLAFRARLPADVESEAALLEQVQGHIRQCTPSHIDFLVGSALKKAGVVTQTPVDVATILFLDKWQLEADGTVVDANGNAIPLGGSLDDAPFELLDNGRVRIGGRTIGYKAAGLATWGKIPGAGEAATGLVPRTDGPAAGATGRSTIRTDIGGQGARRRAPAPVIRGSGPLRTQASQGRTRSARRRTGNRRSACLPPSSCG